MPPVVEVGSLNYWTAREFNVSIWNDENILKLDYDDDCTIL